MPESEKHVFEGSVVRLRLSYTLVPDAASRSILDRPCAKHTRNCRSAGHQQRRDAESFVPSCDNPAQCSARGSLGGTIVTLTGVSMASPASISSRV